MYTPEDLDVVWCAFPYHDDPSKPGPKSRPCLVLGRESNLLTNGESFVYVAYGTSKTFKGGKYSVTIGRDDRFSMIDAGLIFPTAFKLDQVAALPFNKQFFPDAPSPSGFGHKDHCRMGAFNEKCRRALVRVFKNMSEDGLDLSETLFSAKKMRKSLAYR